VYGWGTWDGWVSGGPGGDEAAPDEAVPPVLARDPAVAGLGLVRARFGLTLNGHALLGTEIQHLRGTSGPTLVTGRFPANIDEIALGENTADDLHVHIGGHVTAEGPAGHRRLTVVGTAAFPPFDADPLAHGFLVLRGTTAALGFADECNTNDCFQNLAVSWRDGTDVDAAIRRVKRAGFDVERPSAGAEIRRLNEVDSLPRVLAGAVAAVAAIGLAHTFAVTVARRRRELAVTRALGFTRRQVRRVIVVQGLVLGLLSAIAGGVFGVVAARIAWAQAANAIGIPRGLPIAAGTVAAMLVAMAALATILAIPWGLAAARARPAVALREDR
jgi:putative ABC transport system permease protein